MSGASREGPEESSGSDLRPDSSATRAQALNQVGRSADALHDWDEIDAALKGQLSPAWRSQRAQARARAGQHAQACSEAESLAKQNSRSVEALYDAACIHSLASAAVLKDDKLSEDERKTLAEKYAARAVALLKDAVSKGYKNLDHIKKDADLDAVRLRDDFKQLLADLEKPKP